MRGYQFINFLRTEAAWGKIYLRNLSKLGRIIGMESCQSAHEMLYAFDGFLNCSVETAKKAFVVRIGRFLNFSVSSSCKT